MNPTTKYSFSDLFKDVLDLSGKSRDSSGDDLTEAKRIVNHAYRKFLIAHDWSFLKMQGVLVTTSGDYDYDLPDDFAELIDGFYYSPDDSHKKVIETGIGTILNLRSMSESTGRPYLFAIRPSGYDATDGTKWEVLFKYTPNGEYELLYMYRIGVDVLVNDDDIPVGGFDHAPTVRNFCLSEVEKFFEDGKVQIHTKELYDILLPQSIEKDKNKRPRSLGFLRSGERVPYDSNRVGDIYFGDVNTSE